MEIERRESFGKSEQTQSAMERIEAAAQLERDRIIKNFMDETGYDRKTAGRSTRNKSPAEIQKEIDKIKERQKLISQGRSSGR